MIENIEQAKERFKRLVDFYKLNDPNNYDYDDRDLISMKLVLEEIERLNKIIKELEEGFKATTEDLCEESTKIEKAIEYIEERYNGEVLTHTFDKDNVGELLEILDKEN